jgi:regulator of replication initiation timing
MQNQQSIIDENNKLKKEIESLKNKLSIVKAWMEREIKEQTHKIARSKTSKLTTDIRQDFLNENFEELIANRINSYF